MSTQFDNHPENSINHAVSILRSLENTDQLTESEQESVSETINLLEEQR